MPTTQAQIEAAEFAIKAANIFATLGSKAVQLGSRMIPKMFRSAPKPVGAASAGAASAGAAGARYSGAGWGGATPGAGSAAAAGAATSAAVPAAAAATKTPWGVVGGLYRYALNNPGRTLAATTLIPVAQNMGQAVLDGARNMNGYAEGVSHGVGSLASALDQQPFLQRAGFAFSPNTAMHSSFMRDAIAKKVQQVAGKYIPDMTPDFIRKPIDNWLGNYGASHVIDSYDALRAGKNPNTVPKVDQYAGAYGQEYVKQLQDLLAKINALPKTPTSL